MTIPIFPRPFTYEKVGGRSLPPDVAASGFAQTREDERPLDEHKVFETYFELPDGYQVQMMVLQDFPGGRQKRGLRRNIFRSRIWIGHEAEPEPLLHRSQEVTDLQLSIDACFSLLLSSAPSTVDSPTALAAIKERVHAYFTGAAHAI